MRTSGDDRMIFDALEEAQALYDRYLELSRIADLTQDEQEEPAPPTVTPMEITISQTPAGVVLNRP